MPPKIDFGSLEYNFTNQQPNFTNLIIKALCDGKFIANPFGRDILCTSVISFHAVALNLQSLGTSENYDIIN
jgi:hypothetical protein